MMRLLAVLAILIVGVSSAAAQSVILQNAESVRLLVTVIEQNEGTGPMPAKGVVLWDSILDAGAQHSVGCNVDSSGKCHIVWEASTELPPPGSGEYPKCGSGDVSNLSDGTSITLTVSGTC